MADWSQLVKGFQQGAEFSQNFRRNRQLEKARDLDLEGANYDMESRRANRRVRDPMSKGLFGELDPTSVKDWNGQLPDPFAFKLFDFIKSKVKGKKKQALTTGSITPTDSTSQGTMPAPSTMPTDDGGAPVDDYAQPVDDEAAGNYADGGDIDPEEVRKRAERYRAQTRGNVQNATQEAAPAAESAAGGAAKQGLVRRALNSKVGRGAAALTAASAMMDQTDPDYDTRIAKRFGFDDPATRTGDNTMGFPEFLGKRALGYASDIGDKLTFGAAGKFYKDKQEDEDRARAAAQPQQAIPTPPQAQAPQRMALDTMQVRAKPAARPAISARPQLVDFSNLDIDPKDVPDMKTDDWKQYRAQLMEAARLSGDPSRVANANKMVTQMQQEGFLNYAQQGLALQQAGNAKGAMAAYRAAYQYFPNGHDVEFGVFNDPKTQRSAIVGFGKDEKTGKIVPGSQLVMDPERVAALIDNFKNPAAFTAWTKDWRDFNQRERQYQEVTKPLARAQAHALENRSEADILRAENAQLKAGQTPGAGAAMRNAEHVFRQRVEMLGIQDEAQADYLASVMSQIKSANPSLPDNSIVQAIMQAQRDGTLKQRLQQLGIQ